MFQLYETKPVVKPALQITPNDIIHKIDESTSLFERNGREVKFSHTAEVVVGDYVVRQSEKDIYHCPQDVFIKKYRALELKNLTFGQAIEAAKSGSKIARKGWNGRGIFIKLQTPDENSKMTHPYTYIDTTELQTDNPDAPKDRVPWFASQTDMLAEDWMIVE